MKGLSYALAQRGIGVLLLHPGWVGPDAPLMPAQSVHGMRALVENFRPEMNARYFRHDGTGIPW